MPFPMKIQPVDSQALEVPARFEPVKPVVKSRFKRLFERQFLRNSAAEKAGAVEEQHFSKDGFAEFEPSSVCLAKMVQNFIEENNEKQQPGAAARCSRNRCNCFNRNCNDNSEDELDLFGSFGLGDSNLSSSGEASEILKSLVPCPSLSERNLLADTARIVDKNKIGKRKDDFCRKIVTDGLLALGYDASICKSRWEKSPSYPAGEYEYLDVIIEGERLLVDIGFRSEFEMARSTKNYKSILQTVPCIFVGKADRLQKIIAIVSEAAKQSLKKKGMHIPPWRKADYVKAKWLSHYTRASLTPTQALTSHQQSDTQQEEKKQTLSEFSNGEKSSVDDAELGDSIFTMSESFEEEEKKVPVVKDWKPPEIKPKSSSIGIKIVTGLASIIEDEP